MLNYLNSVLSGLRIKIKPLSSDTGESENFLNGLNIVLSYIKEQQILRICCDLFVISGMDSTKFTAFEQDLLELNSLDFLFSDYKIGINFKTNTVQINSYVPISGDQTELGESILRQIKGTIFFAAESKRRLIQLYNRYQ